MVGVELERIVVAVGKEGCADESGTDVVEMDVSDASEVAELGEAFQIVVVVALGSRIGWGGTLSTCASYAADDGEMSLLVGMLEKVMKSGVNHLCEAGDVGGDGGHLLVDVERGVLMTDAGAVEVEIHAAGLANEGEESPRGIRLGDIDALGGDDIKVFALNLLQAVLPSTSDAHLPSLGGEHLDEFESDA